MPSPALREVDPELPPLRERLEEMRAALVEDDLSSQQYMDPSRLQLLAIVGGALSALRD
jgi:hypothetical protein